MRKSLLIVITLFLLLISGQAPVSQTLKTDINLVMAIDCSYSVNTKEFQLQVDGIANALISPEIIQSIESGEFGRIGIYIFQWSGPNIQEVVIPWTLIDTAEDAYRVAGRLLSTPRLTSEGVTAMGNAINFGARALAQAPFWSERRVVDVQADGTATWSRGIPIQHARNSAVEQGIIINGLPILNEVPYLHHYFENHVIGGAGSFIEIAENYQSFSKAIKRKLLREIRGLNLF